jgi:hypothetical protein
VISDLSRSLRSLMDNPGLAVDFPELEAAAIVFDRPTQTFSPSETTLDLFLYDIRENTALRSNEPEVVRNGFMAETRRPPMRVDCAYLVTAWPVGGTDLPLQEHRLLSQALQVLIRHPTLPTVHLVGQLTGQEPPLPLLVPEVDGLKSAGEFWTAMGNQLRASFTILVTISVPALPSVTGPVVTTKTGRFAPALDGDTETLLQVGGRVLDGSGDGVAGAVVDLLDTGSRAMTNDEGRYLLSQVPAGNRSLRVAATGFQIQTQSVPVPGAPDDYDITLTPL